MKALKFIALLALIAAIFTYEVWMGGFLLMWFQMHWLTPVFGVAPFAAERIAVYTTMMVITLINWHLVGRYKNKKTKFHTKEKGFNVRWIGKFTFTSIIIPLISWGLMAILVWLCNR